MRGGLDRLGEISPRKAGNFPCIRNQEGSPPRRAGGNNRISVEQ